MRINLSEQTNELLHSIYQQYVAHRDSQFPDSYASRTISSHFLFSDSDNRQVMSSIAELSSKRMVSFYSDNRITIHPPAICYIEKQLAKQKDRNL